MKKNITINLFGTLYNIDEDAYELLDNYLQSMKRYFGTLDGGEDIADDIEHRVAELLWEKKEQGTNAISLEIIKEIIGKIGNAEEIAGDGKADETQSEEKAESKYSADDDRWENTDDFDASTASMWQRIRHHFSNRRLYRDADNQLLGGVCSGLAHFFGFGDPVLWRLLVLLLFLYKGVGLLTYLILWLIVPMARTPEDKLRMKGIQLNAHNINRQVIIDHQNMQCSTDNSNSSMTSGCLKLLFGLFILFPLGFIILFVLLFAIAAAGVLGGVGSAVLSTSEFGLFETMFDTCGTMFLIGIGCILVVLIIVFILLIRLIFGSNKPMGKLTRIALGIIVGVCLSFGIFSIAQTITKYISLEEEYNVQQCSAIYRSHGNNLFKPQPHLDLPYLKECGFNIINNTCNRCTWSGDYPTGDPDRRYLDACDYYLLDFTAERTDTVEPGTYSITALVRAEGEGAFLYIKAGKGGVYTENMVSIPPLGNQGGNLWKWACGNTSLPEVHRFYPELYNDSIRQQIAFANNGKGFGWTLLTITGIKVDEGQVVKYGITTEQDLARDKPNCDWVSATDFVLTKTK